MLNIHLHYKHHTCFVFFNRQLQDGNLQCNGVTDGSKITLLPNVETGLIVSIENVAYLQQVKYLFKF